MGYHTEFAGFATATPSLNAAEVAYLTRFNDSRRWNRPSGPYDTADDGYRPTGGRNPYNEPPPGQPGLWCPWRPTEDGTMLEWDGGEKPYDSEAWMTFLIATFLSPHATLRGFLRSPSMLPTTWAIPREFDRFTFNHTLTGGFHAWGEERDDNWTLLVEGNRVRRVEGHVDLPTPEAERVEWTIERIYPDQIEA